MAPSPDTDDPVEELISLAVQELELRGEPGLQEFLTRHGTHARAVREGLERLRHLGILSPPAAAPVERTQYGEFRVLRRLGSGGMGVVYAAEQTSLQRTVALKVVRPEFLASAQARGRFQREVEAIARLSHPGIVPILAVGNDDSQPWFAMEYVEGHTLDDLLAAMQGRDPARADGSTLRSRFGDATRSTAAASAAFAGSYWEACARLVLQVATTMAYVHERGIVHRDLKPSNVVVTRQGRAMVLDFGLAHVRDLHRVTRDERPLGSPAYMSPEQVRGEAVDERVDVYGLGVTLYELLTTHLPFPQESREALQQAIVAGSARPVRTWNRSVPRDLEIVCAVAMDRDRSRRYRSMADFAADLDAVLARRPILARPLGAGLRLVRLAQRRPSWAIAALALLLVALQFPLVLWRQQAAANQDLAKANADLDRQRRIAVDNSRDAIAAIEQMLLQTSRRELITTPGTEAMQLSILQRAEQLLERLRQKRPGYARLEFLAAQNLQYIGGLLGDRGDFREAEAKYARAIEILADWPGPEYLHLRGTVWRLLGLSLSRRGAVADAEAAAAQAQCDLDNAMLATPWDRALRLQAAEALVLMARVREQQGDPDARLQLLLRAQELKDRLHEEQPNELDGALVCALGCEHLAVELRKRDPAAALQHAERGLAVLAPFVPVGASERDLRTRLSGLFEVSGHLHEDLGRLAEMEQDYGKALALRWSLAQDFPATASHWHMVAASLNNLAIVRANGREIGDAVDLGTESVAKYRQAARMAPGNVEFAHSLELALGNRAGFLLQAHDLDALGPAIDDLVAVARQSQSFVTAALYSLRLGARLRERDGDAAEPQMLAWRERAVGFVEAAIARGWNDRAYFETGKQARWYDDIRAWPEFAAAMAKLPPAGR